MSDIRSFTSVDVAAGQAAPPTPAEEGDILREMLLRLPDAVAYVDADGAMRLVNDAFLQIHDIDRGDIAPLRTPESRFRWQFETGRQTLTHATLEESVAHVMARRATPDGRPNIRQYNDQWFDHRFIGLPEGRTMVVFRDISELKRQQAEARETLDHLRAFNAVLQAMSRSALDLETVLRTAISSAVNFCGADRAIVYRYRDGACHVEVCHNAPPDYEVLERSNPIPPGNDTVVGRALLQLRTVQIVDAQTDPDYGPREEAILGGLHSMIGVPLLRDGQPTGVIALATTSVKPFSGREVEVVTTFADQAAIAIENARLLQETQLARETAERERALMQAILGNVTDGMGLFEVNGDLLLLNDAMYEINGFPREAFADCRNIRQIFLWQAEAGQAGTEGKTPAEMAARAMDWFVAGTPYTMTSRRDNGRWVDVRWQVLPDGRRLITHRDVTPLKQQEAALEAARAEADRKRATMKAVIDNATDGLALIQTDGTALLLEAELDARMAVFFQSEQYRHERYRYGRYLDVRWIPLPDGRRLVVHRDVTELREREEEVRQARALMDTVLETMGDGVILWDKDGAWAYANSAFCEIQLSSPERLASLRTFPGMMDALVQRGVADTAFRDAANERFHKADGTPKLRPTHDGRWVEGAFHRVADGGTLGMFRDVTRLKQQEDRIAQERDAAETAQCEAEAANQAKQPVSDWISVDPARRSSRCGEPPMAQPGVGVVEPVIAPEVLIPDSEGRAPKMPSARAWSVASISAVWTQGSAASASAVERSSPTSRSAPNRLVSWPDSSPSSNQRR